jgi:hypothetical protein
MMCKAVLAPLPSVHLNHRVGLRSLCRRGCLRRGCRCSFRSWLRNAAAAAGQNGRAAVRSRNRSKAAAAAAAVARAQTQDKVWVWAQGRGWAAAAAGALCRMLPARQCCQRLARCPRGSRRFSRFRRRRRSGANICSIWSAVTCVLVAHCQPRSIDGIAWAIHGTLSSSACSVGCMRAVLLELQLVCLLLSA